MVDLNAFFDFKKEEVKKKKYPVGKYLVASFLYYHCDFSIMEDEDYSLEKLYTQPTKAGVVDLMHTYLYSLWKLAELIDKEDKQKPHSDDDLVSELSKLGLNVARRTITKYRKKLGIPSSRQRKDWSKSK